MTSNSSTLKPPETLAKKAKMVKDRAPEFASTVGGIARPFAVKLGLISEKKPFFRRRAFYEPAILFALGIYGIVRRFKRDDKNN